MKLTPLPRGFYLSSTTTEIAAALLGHYLVRRLPDGPCGGIITETEAYLKDDPASHSYRGQTPRNRTMWGDAGHGYVYQIYGIHFCVNAVCRPPGTAEAVLLRAIEPAFGRELMEKNRRALKPEALTSGPANLCAAMLVNLAHDGVDLCNLQSPLFIARNPSRARVIQRLGPTVQTTRIGLTRAAEMPLRFYLGGSRYVSKRAAAAPQP